MKYCAHWCCDDIMLGMLIPIPISVYLYRTNILCFNNQFTSSYNFSIICCIIGMKHQHYPEHDNVILYIFFPSIIYCFPLIKHTFLAVIFCQMGLKLLSETYNIYLLARVHLHLGIKYVWSSKFNSGNQLVYKELINIIYSIYNLDFMSRFTYDLINYNGVTLVYNWHKVQCRGTYILFSTTISFYPFYTQWCCQYFLSLRKEIRRLLCAVVVETSYLLLSNWKIMKCCMTLTGWCNWIYICLW